MTTATLNQNLPRQTRSQRRYQAWLDADSGMKFGDWLKNGQEEPDNTCRSCQGTGIGNPRIEGSNCWSCNGRGYSLPKREIDV